VDQCACSLFLTKQTRRRLYITTWNNAFSDIADGTLIAHGTQIFNDAARLREGQSVEFSGALYSDPTDCFRTKNMTMDTVMKEPGFLFRFTSISAVN
jgi:hypothetical protein